MKSYSQFLWHFLLQQKYGFILLMVCQFAWAIDQSVLPYFFKILTDTILLIGDNKENAWGQLSFPLILIAGLWILTEVMYRTYDFASAKVYPRLEAAIRAYMFDYVSDHSHQFFANNFSGRIANKISDISSSSTRIMQLLLQLFIPSLLAFIIAFVLFGSLHPLFAVILGVWVLLHMGVAFLFAKSGNMASKVHSESRSLVIGQIVDSFTNYLNVMLFSRKRFETRYVAKFQEKEVELHTKALRIIAKARLLQGFLCALLPGLFLTWFMLHMWMIDAITVSDVVYIFYGSWNIVILAWISGIELPNFFKECGVCSQALSVIIPEHEVVDAKGAKALKVKDGRLAFKDVTFNYSEKKPLFKKVNLEIEPGQKVGLVGVSGGGKTTFVNLILRLFDVKNGVIEIDGQPIDSVTLKSLREKIALIPQEPTLFHRTLVENIRYGKIDASDKKVKEAAKRAHCEEFINKLEDGYQTYVGERGVKLSGGQRQRIAIARAILKDAPILILDEATSALDSVTEKEIQDSLDYLMKGRTVLVIAHRLSTLKGMDRIIVFDKGKIVEDGTHNSLLKKGKHYAKLWKMQSHGFLMDEEK